MKKKRNNKGFSLVELIVVIAIMAILAVTLAPRLTQYIDKARQANDRELVNTIYTTVKYSLLDDSINTDAVIHAAGKYNSTAGTTTIKLQDGADDTVTTDDIYTVTDISNGGARWTKTTNTIVNNKLIAEILSVIDDFNLQSHKATGNAEITIVIKNAKEFTVELDYEGDGTIDYTLNSANES